MSSVKISTKIQSFQDVQKSLQDIEKYLNKLEKSIQSPAELEVTDKDGKTGDLKTTKNTDGSYTFEVRTVDGWKTPVFQEHPITFKEKLSSYSKKKLAKSISDIQADDTTKGTSIADKTIFDEKNNKFDVSHLTGGQTGGLMKPDFNSGWVWFDWSEHHWNGSHPAWKFAHTTESLPTLVTIQVAPGLTGNPTSGTDEALISDQSTITWFTEMNNHFGDSYGNNQVYGLTYKVDKDYVYVDGAESQSGFISDYDGTNTSSVSFQDCSIRILLWK